MTHRVVSLLSLVFLCVALPAHTQANPGELQPYSRRNTFTVFGEYSNDSSHIVLGTTPNRKLAAVGAQYERRLFEKRLVRLSYVAEFRPFIVSSDPLETTVTMETSTVPGGGFGPISDTYEPFQCIAGTNKATFTDPQNGGVYTDTQMNSCARQNTLAQGGSPLGLRINFRPRSPLQLTFSSNGGYMFATKPIPIPSAGSFNFTFEFGGGLEYFYASHRSIRLEYVIQHYSNKFTAQSNPGVDNGFIKLTYAFGH